jgi:hypothetical protein
MPTILRFIPFIMETPIISNSADLKSLDFRGTWGEWIEMEYMEQQKADFRQRFGLARGKANGLRLFAL